MFSMKILVSGSKSGLGKYLFERMAGISWDRSISDKVKNELKDNGVDIIIHCAFNPRSSVDLASLYGYLSDNVLLTEELLNIPHEKFIFISSADVYPKDKKNHRENEVIDINAVGGIYGVTKLMSEVQVIKRSHNFLILRCTAMLGKYSRKNSLIKIIEDTRELTLSGRSTFNYVLHSDIFDFIKYVIKKDIRGIYNIATSKNITFLEVANILRKEIKFGSYIYNVGEVDNSKISGVFPAFKKTSKEVILQFIKE